MLSLKEVTKFVIRYYKLQKFDGYFIELVFVLCDLEIGDEWRTRIPTFSLNVVLKRKSLRIKIIAKNISLLEIINSNWHVDNKDSEWFDLHQLLFLSRIFNLFLKWGSFFAATSPVLEIGPSLKPNQVQVSISTTFYLQLLRS